MLPRTPMASMRWAAAGRQLNGHNLPFSSRIQSSLAPGNRAYVGTRAIHHRHPLLERVPALRLRAGRSSPAQLKHVTFSTNSRLLARETNIVRPSSLPPHHGPILQSAFPTKTFIALLVLGTVVYFAVGSIQIQLIEHGDFVDGMGRSSSGDFFPTPFHLQPDREQLNLWMQRDMPDPVAMMKDPEVLQEISDGFSVLARGWELGEDVGRTTGMPATHGCRFQSNTPCEDFFALGTSPGTGGNSWNYWSIYDGHAGNSTAAHLQRSLMPHVSLALSNLSPASSSETIQTTIKDAFVKVDAELMTKARNAANWYPAASAAAIMALAPAFSGSCALLAAFDRENDILRVACVGDSRAVLGRWDPESQKYTAHPLSVDQTGFNEDEFKRITEAHPDEPDILDPKSGRLLGLMVTRAFGDHRWKWENSFISQLQTKFWGTAPRPKSQSPPYLTAEPVVTETNIVRVDPADAQAGKSDFLIMASDGLWDHMSSDVAVSCVESWLAARSRGNGLVSNDPQRPSFTPPSPSLSPEAGVTYDVDAGKEITWQAEPQYFSIEDDNAAVCLARNAMGGSRRGLFLGVVSCPAPMKRDAVDDTTVMVVFFDRVRGEGEGMERVDVDGDGGKKKKSLWWPF